jgi:hypothetical protein
MRDAPSLRLRSVSSRGFGWKETHTGAVAFTVAGGLAGVFKGGVVDGAMAAGAEFSAERLQFVWSEAARPDGGFFLFWRLSSHWSSLGSPLAARATLAQRKKMAP